MVLSTIDQRSTALSLAHRLVDENLVACVNIIPGISSVYKWQGKIEESSEVLLVLKSTQDRVEAMTMRLQELHPYDVPEILVLPVEGGSVAYLEWVEKVTRSERVS